MNRGRANASFILTLFVGAVCLAPVLVAGAFRAGSSQAPPERKLKARAFNGIPLKVKEVRNLQKEGDDWFRDLEIEVENISDNPIYYISLIVEFPDIAAPPPQVREDGSTPSRSTTGFWLSFGSRRLGDVKKLATPDDIALRPGETYVFKIPDGWVKGFEHLKKEKNLRPDQTGKMELEFSIISFGDGTGYIAGEKRAYLKKKVTSVGEGAAPPPIIQKVSRGKPVTAAAAIVVDRAPGRVSVPNQPARAARQGHVPGSLSS